MTTHDSYEIGTSTTTRVNVELLTSTSLIPFPPPRSTFQPYSQPVELGDATVRGAGYPVAEWHWDFLTTPQRDALRAFCTGASATVYVKTKTMETANTYGTFQAIMLWPPAEERIEKGDRSDFNLVFRCIATTTA